MSEVNQFTITTYLLFHCLASTVLQSGDSGGGSDPDSGTAVEGSKDTTDGSDSKDPESGVDETTIGGEWRGARYVERI